MSDSSSDSWEDEEEEFEYYDSDQYQHSSDFIEYLLDNFQQQTDSLNSNHSNSQLDFLSLIQNTLVKKLNMILKERPILAYHGPLLGHLSTLLRLIEAETINEVALADSQIASIEDVDSLSAFIIEKGVTILKLSGAAFTSFIFFERLMSSLTNSEIKTLQLGVPFSATLAAVSPLLLSNTTLIDLDMNHLVLQDDDDLEELANIVGDRNCRLEKLTFYDCTISKAKWLANIIETNKSLNYLDLGSMDMPYDEYLILFDAFRKNSTIEYFFLDKISDPTLTDYMLDCWKDNKSLLKHKDHTKFGDTFIKNPRVASFFESNRTNSIRRLDIAKNFVNVSRKLLLLNDLPIELKMITLQVCLEDCFMLDSQILVKFGLNCSIGKLPTSLPFSARNLIIAALNLLKN